MTPLSWSLDHVGPITRTARGRRARPRRPRRGRPPGTHGPRSAGPRGSPGPRRAARTGTWPDCGSASPATTTSTGSHPRWRTRSAQPSTRLRAARRRTRRRRHPDDRVHPGHPMGPHGARRPPPSTNGRCAPPPSCTRPTSASCWKPVSSFRPATTCAPSASRTLMRRAWAQLFDEVDVIAAPTVTSTAARSDQQTVRMAGRLRRERVRHLRPAARPRRTSPASRRSPFPVGLDRAGLPIGMQLIGRPLGEATILGVGRAYEATHSLRRASAAPFPPPRSGGGLDPVGRGWGGGGSRQGRIRAMTLR